VPLGARDENEGARWRCSGARTEVRMVVRAAGHKRGALVAQPLRDRRRAPKSIR